METMLFAYAVYSSTGQKLETLIFSELSTGNHSFTWNAENYVSGLYVYRLKIDRRTKTRKCLLIK